MAILLMGASVVAQAQSNPYATYLNIAYDSSSLPPTIVANNDDLGSFFPIGEDMQSRVWALTSTNSTATSGEKTTLTNQIQTELNYMLSGTYYVAGHWVVPGQGWNASSDCNNDRFNLTTVMETLYQLKANNILTSSTNWPIWTGTAQAAVDYQYLNYGQGAKAQHPDWSTGIAGGYANQDLAYADILGDAALLYGNSVVVNGTTFNYASSAAQYILDVKNHVQSGGSLPYVGGTNPYVQPEGADIDYTNIDICWLAFYLQDNPADSNALATLKSMQGYFPKQLVNAGFSEASTTPWLKDSVTPVVGCAGAVDVIAGLTGDPLNAYYAQTLLAYSGRFGPDAGACAVPGALFWQPVTAGTPSANIAFPDYDITGSRGHFGAFNWVGVLNPSQVTCVGATVAATNFAPNSSFEAIESGTDIPVGYSNIIQSGAPVFSISGTWAHSGSNSVEITGTGPDKGAIICPNFPVIPGHDYTFSVWYSTSGTAMRSGAVLCQVEALNFNAQAIDWQQGWILGGTNVTYSEADVPNLWLGAKALSSGSWTQMSMTFSGSNATVADGGVNIG
jgi:hypothetical protein